MALIRKSSFIKLSSYSLDRDFLERHNIDPDEVGWAGSGDNGHAYHCSDDRILKVTKSKEEFDIAERLIGHNFENIVQYYAAEKVKGEYYILMEEVEPVDEDAYQQAVDLLSTQGLVVTYVDHFDEDTYEEEYGENSGTSVFNMLHSQKISS